MYIFNCADKVQNTAELLHKMASGIWNLISQRAKLRKLDDLWEQTVYIGPTANKTKVGFKAERRNCYQVQSRIRLRGWVKDTERIQ